MKTYLIIFIIIITLFDKVCGQSTSVYINNLIKYHVITAKERPQLEKELQYKKYYLSNRGTILAGIETILLQKTFHINPHKTGLFYSYKIDSANNKWRDSINTSLHSLLEKINKSGLLTNKIYLYAYKKIDSNNYDAGMQMVGHLAEMTIRMEWLEPDKLLPLAEQLHKNGIVSDTSFLRLQNDIKNDKIESSFQLNNYFRYNKTFDLTKYPNDPSTWLEPLLKKISTILPGLSFSGFNYTIEPDTVYGIKIKGDDRIKLKVNITCNRRIYKYSISEDKLTNKKGEVHYIGITAQFIYRIFNKVLTDEQSPLRISSVSFHHSGGTDDDLKHFAFIALKYEQTEMFMKYPCLNYMLTFPENYDNTLTSGRIDSTINEWKKMGLFAHISAEEIDKGTDNAETADLRSMNELLTNFPGIVCNLYPSAVIPEHPYVDFLNQLAAITHGAFRPTMVTEQKMKDGTKLQFVSNGKTYVQLFKWPFVELDPVLPEFLKSIVKENNLPGSFYPLPYAQSVIYLTKQQYAYVKEHKLIDFDAEKRISEKKQKHSN